MFADFLERIESRHVGQPYVQQHRVRITLLHQLNALSARRGCDNFEAVGLETFLQRVQDIGFVVDDEQFRHGALPKLVTVMSSRRGEARRQQAGCRTPPPATES